MHENSDKERKIAAPSKLLGIVKGMFRFLLGSLLFSIAYTQPPLYYSNQHQYFLHGLAWGGRGFLTDDWLANTADPTPLFSAVVALTYRYLHESLFYLYYILLLGIYFHALVGIFVHLSDRHPMMLTRLGFVVFFIALHCALSRWTSAQLFGVDYPWYFQAGVANQYILGAGLQPSVFGVLLVLSVYAFLQNRPFLAATWSSLAAVMHSTYLLSAAFLTLAYLYLLIRDKRIREALFVGLWSLFVVSPVIVYNLVTFAPYSPKIFNAAQSLLAHFRIPHHAQVNRWMDGIACGQIGWILLAAYLVRGNRLFVILIVPFVLSLSLTLVQIGTDNDTLALLFPWRTSSILVPLATTVILTRIVNRLADWFASSSLLMRRTVGVIYGFVLVIFVFGGVYITYFDLGYRTNKQELGLLEHIRATKAAGEVYLLPVEVPKLKLEKGAASLNFTPPPQRSTQNKNISVDLQQFRLFTGASIYIDFKSIPYKDVEVMEWYERILWNQQFYKRHDWNDDKVKAEWRERAITHVVTTADHSVRCDALQLIYADEYYRLYRVRLP